MMIRPSTTRMVYCIAFGYAVIINLIGTSYYDFYPTSLLIGVAFGIGIAMVVGSIYFFLAEPRMKPRPIELPDAVPFHTAVARPRAVPV